MSIIRVTLSVDDMNEGKEYAKFGKMRLKNHVSLSHHNILQHAHQWAQFHMKKHLSVSLPKMFFHMCSILILLG